MPHSKCWLWKKGIPSLLDSGTQVTLICQICQGYIEREVLPHIVPSSREKAEAHQLVQVTAVNNGKLSVSMYVELDVDFLGIVVPNVGLSLLRNPMSSWMNDIEPKCQALLAGLK